MEQWDEIQRRGWCHGWNQECLLVLGKLRESTEDVLIFVHSTPADGAKLLGRLREGSAERALGLQLLREGDLQNDDGCVTPLTLLRNIPGKGTGARRQ